MAELKGTKTHEALKEAFAGESQANRRYLFWARQAELEGKTEVAELFRDTAESETGHAFGHLEFLVAVGDPGTDLPMTTAEETLKAAAAGETYEFTAMYPTFAKTAREEGFEEIADWFSTLARAERTHAGRYEKALEKLQAQG
jgi:rubrerythrin